MEGGYQPNKGNLDIKNPPKGGSCLSDFETIKKVNLKKDDVIVLTTERILTDERAICIKKQIKNIFSKNKVIIIANGVTLKIVNNKNFKEA